MGSGLHNCITQASHLVGMSRSQESEVRITKMNVQHRTSNIERPIKNFAQLPLRHALCPLLTVLHCSNFKTERANGPTG